MKEDDNFLKDQSYMNGQDYNTYDSYTNNGNIDNYKDVMTLHNNDDMAESNATYFDDIDFSMGFNEATMDIPLVKWNQKQRELWKALAANGVVEPNDVTTFKMFASYFDRYYKKFHTFPKYSTIILAMRGY